MTGITDKYHKIQVSKNNAIEYRIYSSIICLNQW